MAETELTCKELVELVTDYLEGTLPLEAHQRFESHLVGCKGCQAYLKQMRKTITLVGKLTEESVTPRQEQTLLRVFRHWKTETPAQNSNSSD
ncbi:MAG: zf-HC2 domain-containing protein [Chloroflexota bacterium]